MPGPYVEDIMGSEFLGSSGLNFKYAPRFAGILAQPYEYVTSNLLAAATFVNANAYPLYTLPNDGTTWKAVSASVRYSAAAASAATVQVFYDGAAVAPGAGTAQFAAMALNGTPNTTVNAITPVGTVMGAGGSISIAAAGAATTSLVNMVVVVAIQRLS